MMLSSIRTTIARKRARSFVKNARAWYLTCQDISGVMGDALHDQSIITKDIGYVIEQVDRKLFHLGFYISDSLGTLRRRNPNLAQRFDQVTQQVCQLRNQTTVFLIRSQGPGPMSGAETDEGISMIYYYRALEEVGFKARDLKVELDRELKNIWRDLQKIFIQEEMATQ
ncbi:MAG: hypothetical protein MUO57_15265 [Anaerolineales bacterium]|nr:hypothetical protein [Anaerolineales bacterium]